MSQPIELKISDNPRFNFGENAMGTRFHFISENSMAYWVSIDDYGVFIKIDKENWVGKKLTECIFSTDSRAMTKTWECIVEIFLKNITASQFRSFMVRQYVKAKAIGANELREKIGSLMKPDNGFVNL